MPKNMRRDSPTACWAIGMLTSVLSGHAKYPAPARLACTLGTSREHGLRQSSRDRRAFVEVQVSSEEVPAQHRE